jgi:hypothetical protein
VLSAPPEPSLLNLTSAWTHASTLGDLRELKASPDYAELRVWGGFGFGATQGIVLRRVDGRWAAFLARVRRCEMQISRSAADTASGTTMQRFVADTRRHCDTPLGEVGAGVRIITADTLAVEQLDLPASSIDSVWTAAMRAGVSQLPGFVKRAETPSSDFTYVVELRRGNEYRASQIEHVEQPGTDADRQVQRVYAAIITLLPVERRLTP